MAEIDIAQGRFEAGRKKTSPVAANGAKVGAKKRSQVERGHKTLITVSVVLIVAAAVICG